MEVRKKIGTCSPVNDNFFKHCFGRSSSVLCRKHLKIPFINLMPPWCVRATIWQGKSLDAEGLGTAYLPPSDCSSFIHPVNMCFWTLMHRYWGKQVCARQGLSSEISGSPLNWKQIDEYPDYKIIDCSSLYSYSLSAYLGSSHRLLESERSEFKLWNCHLLAAGSWSNHITFLYFNFFV